MRIDGKAWRTIWPDDDGRAVHVIDQTKLPDALETVRLGSLDDVAIAIANMTVRGAPLIGVAAAYGLAIALRADPSDAALDHARSKLLAARPTAVNLRWALDVVGGRIAFLSPSDRANAAWACASTIAEDDVVACAKIGEHGAALLRELAARAHGRPLRVLTHCNAGWLATVDHGTALAPIYRLFDDGVPIEVWVDETRPRDQGYLTAWELTQHGVPCTVIADNAGGHLMQRGEVDACLVGSDRTTRNGDVCNKIGTYLKALAARDAGIPFYVALPSSTIDFSLADGDSIPIEERSPHELTRRQWVKVRNPAFDVTPARLVSGIITERGVSEASEEGLRTLFPEHLTANPS